MYREIILHHLLDYFNKIDWKIKYTGKIANFQCPICKAEGKTAQTIPHTYKFNCFVCKPKDNKGDYYNLLDVVRINEEDKSKSSDEEILHYLKELLNINVVTDTDEENFDDILITYENFKFDLVPIIKNGKRPIERDWTNKTHTDKVEWKRWLKEGLNIGCFDEETEILTDKGWKYFKDLDKTEKVATLNWKTNNIVYQYPLAYIEYLYEGKMYKINSNTLDMCITPNHNVFYKQHASNKIELKRMDMINLNRFEIPITGKWKGKEYNYFYFPYNEKIKNCKKFDKIELKLFLEFLGWFISEGHLVKKDYQVIITQTSTIYKKQIKDLLNKLPYKFIQTKNIFKICNKQLYYYLKENCYDINNNSEIRKKSKYCCYNKSIPKFIKSLTPELIKIILTSLVKGDGYKSKRTERYYTTSIKLANDIQELYLKTGYSSILNSRKPRTHIYNGKVIKGKKNALEIIKQTRKFRTVKRKQNIKIIDFKDKVYCVEVPNGIIYVRRNGKSYWSGNCKTGQRSNITVIDIDTKDIPEPFKPYLEKTLMQETQKGYHLFFKYVEDLPKTRIDEFKIDIENKGGQVVLAPSVVNDIKRTIKNTEIIDLPKELYDLLKSKTTVTRKTFSEQVKEDIKTEDFKLHLFDAGSRNSALIRLGGIFRKELNLNQTRFVLHVLNKHNHRSGSYQEIEAMVNQLDRYIEFDKQELSHQILEYLRDAESARKSEIEIAVLGNRAKGEEKKRIDKTLVYLIKEGYILRRGQFYQIIKKAEWKENLMDIGTPINFKVPYFHDIAYFNDGDLILIGSKAKMGKTHIGMNFIKRLVDQGIKPYYISLETGSRFSKIALQLGLKEGDFKHTFCADPTKIEIEKNSVTVIDWLLVIDKAKTDLIFKNFIEQLNKMGGFLIIFQQLKTDNSWFAPNLCQQFPALATRYLYEKDGDGTYGKFVIDVVREGKMKGKIFELPCKYFWETKELKRIEEISDKDKSE